MKTELKKWNPFSEQDNLPTVWNTLFPGFLSRANGQANLINAEDWQPAADIEDDDKQYLITVDLPEVKKEDIKVSIDDGILSITGERNKKEEVKDKTFHRVERFHGSYQRNFKIPENINEDKMNASLKDGALKITLPKEPVENKTPARDIAIT